MKKRIFIAIQYLEIGGAERSLIGLLNAIDYNQYDVDLFLYQHTGEFIKYIPYNVNLLNEVKKYSLINKPIIECLKKGYFDLVFARLIAKVRHNFFLKKYPSKDSYAIFQYVANCITPLLPSLKKYGTYDVAISFLTPHNIVKDKVSSKLKIAWIHTDYSVVKINKKLELPIWEKFDWIISISNDVTKSFLSTFPSLKNKIKVIENILSPNFVKQQAEKFNPYTKLNINQNDIIICSIGRFTRQKNFENIPYICQELKKYNIKFKWFLIGYGGEEQNIRDNIIKTKTENICIILGKKENPYPYIKHCKLYIQPSRYEGKAVTVREAQILGKPIIITNYPTSSSQIDNGKDGIIVPMNNKDIALGIKNLINNNNQIEMITSFLKTHDYGNENEIIKLYNLIN